MWFTMYLTPYTQRLSQRQERLKTVLPDVFKGDRFQQIVFSAKGNAFAGMANHTTIVAAVTHHYGALHGHIVFFTGILQGIRFTVGMSANAFGRTKEIGRQVYFAGYLSF